MVSCCCVSQTLPLVVEECERRFGSGTWTRTSRTCCTKWAASSVRITACWRRNIESVYTTPWSRNIKRFRTRRINAVPTNHKCPNPKHGQRFWWLSFARHPNWKFLQRELGNHFSPMQLNWPPKLLFLGRFSSNQYTELMPALQSIFISGLPKNRIGYDLGLFIEYFSGSNGFQNGASSLNIMVFMIGCF